MKVTKPNDAWNRAVLVHINFQNPRDEDYVNEFQELAKSAGATPVALVRGSRKAPDAQYFVGSGKAEEIKTAAQVNQAKLIFVNHELSPAQERNLEQLTQCKVLDRTGLILHIFALRARTFEGKLQVELAQLQRLSTRLIRGWTHLERQKGGIGLRGGPGETQLEVDRRLIRNRIKNIQKRLEKVRQQRELSRRARKRATVPLVAFVGYTNAGKSTLFNALTRSDVYVADQLFATLDPTLRRVNLPLLGNVILADTVGFIRDLPHDLIEAFRATLEETNEADLLLHVIDASYFDRQSHIEEVEKVIKQIGSDKVRCLQVYNKIDLIPDAPARVDRDEEGRPIRVWLSAISGVGLKELQEVLAEILDISVTNKEV